MSDILGNSSDEQELLRAVALWCADYANEALPVYESRHPGDSRLRDAIEAGRDFGRGKKRDQNLRRVGMAALKAGKGVDEPSKYAVQAATLAAAVAYTHTDLQTGIQGVRQARHILGPIVYAALALEIAEGGNAAIGDAFLQRAVANAPLEAKRLLACMPPQPKKSGRLEALFFDFDTALRA